MIFKEKYIEFYDTKIISKDYGEKISGKVYDLFIEKLPRLGYESREGQENMALDISEAIRDNQHIMIEAGVGIGKSYAYLVPLIYFNLYTNLPVVISTSTIILQEQLVNDIKKISKIIHIYPDVILAKGKSHFKCSKRVLEYLEENITIEEWLELWLKKDENFDRIKLPYAVKDSIWNKINVDDEYCNGKRCELYDSCEYMKLRSKLITTEGIILCNHDLLTMDLRKKQKGIRSILSNKTALIVVDEAHNLEEKVRNSLKKGYLYKSLVNKLREAINFVNRYERELEIGNDIFPIVEKIFNELLRQVIQQKKSIGNIDSDIERYYITIEKISKELDDLKVFVSDLNIKVQLVENDRVEEQQYNIMENLFEIEGLTKNLLDNQSNYLFWIEMKGKKSNINNITIVECPKELQKMIRELFFNNSNFNTILTSATLTDKASGENEDRYRYIIKNIGYPVDEQAILSEPKESPYNYAENSILYYREDMPHPRKQRNEFIEKSIEVITELIELTNGRTMILFTSKEDMNKVYNGLNEKKLKFKLLVQEEGVSQDLMIKEFKEDKNSVLLGTGAYWEGVSIEGEALTSLIIFKLPFSVPDPVSDYKKTLVENPLMEVDVPEMIIKLRQGVGRLIRNATDKGIVTILDSRINDNSKMEYKNIVFEALPIKVKTNNLEDLKEFIRNKSI